MKTRSAVLIAALAAGVWGGPVSAQGSPDPPAVSPPDAPAVAGGSSGNDDSRTALGSYDAAAPTLAPAGTYSDQPADGPYDVRQPASSYDNQQPAQGYDNPAPDAPYSTDPAQPADAGAVPLDQMPDADTGAGYPYPSSAGAAYDDQGPPDVSIFYGELAPYGRWIERRGYGWVWWPLRVEAGWRPYSIGCWRMTDYGWTWISEEPWGWATYHYGRWLFDPRDGWLWVPGTDWGPAWVSFQEGDGYIGWAPLPPSVAFRGGFGLVVDGPPLTAAIDPSAYSFVEEPYFDAPRVRQHILQPARSLTIVRNTVNITNIRVINDRIVNNSIPVARVAQATGRPVMRYEIAAARVPAQNGGVLLQGNQGNRIALFRPAVTLASAKPSVTPQVAIERRQLQQQQARQGPPAQGEPGRPARISVQQVQGAAQPRQGTAQGAQGSAQAQQGPSGQQVQPGERVQRGEQAVRQVELQPSAAGDLARQRQAEQEQQARQAEERQRLEQLRASERNNQEAQARADAARHQAEARAQDEQRQRQQQALAARQERDRQDSQARAEAQARQQSAARAQEAEVRARQESDARARQEADARARQEADARARQEAQARTQKEKEKHNPPPH
ncbi:MAG TPA: DUF6600 domain-containing protein [Thermoanaerobaculia bacterium]|nr:DUF6600 domain-containing protein [Thermoanaerobaculia bacterium]